LFFGSRKWFSPPTPACGSRMHTEMQEPRTVATISSLADVISCSPGATVMIVASKRGSK